MAPAWACDPASMSVLTQESIRGVMMMVMIYTFQSESVLTQESIRGVMMMMMMIYTFPIQVSFDARKYQGSECKKFADPRLALSW